MFPKLSLILLLVSLVHAQLNGEFWWLNNKLNKYRNVQPPEPVIEVLSEFDTDENARIVFRDDPNTGKKNDNIVNKFNNDLPSRERKFVWPSDDFNKFSGKVKEEMKMPVPDTDENDDEFNLSFTIFDKNVTLMNDTSTTAPTTESTNKSVTVNSEIVFNSDMTLFSTVNEKESQSICTYLVKKDCMKSKGILYDYSYKRLKNVPEEQRLICCVLPLEPKAPERNEISAIIFPDQLEKIRLNRRIKRSDTANALKQRNFLLLQKIATQNQRKPVSTSPTKIVTPDYVDPYWNIKNSNFHQVNNEKIQTTKYDYFSQEYSDYDVELPTPGLVGIYSDNSKPPTGWTFGGNKPGYESPDYNNGEDDNATDEEEEVFGYSTIDPRKVVKTKRPHTDQRPKGRPVKLTTSSGEVSINAESHTINFQSNPDFQVLQGFKLLNLITNKSRVITKKVNRKSGEISDANEEVFVSEHNNSYEDNDEEYFEEEQLFGGCGRSTSIRNEGDKQGGDAPNGSHPWMALVVLTKRKQNVLCYATLVHPRAAVAVADCVEGTAPKEITVIVGLWDLEDKSQSRSRIATVHVHPRYKAGQNDNNLAILYWMRPLKLGANVQPACLAEHHAGDQCKFFGWGGINQGVQSQSRWQKATIRSCDNGIRSSKNGARVSEVFCASVTRSGVAGIGGGLICGANGHSSIVGMVVSREQVYKLLPIHGFAMKASKLLSAD